jgi:two-component system, NarL family, response regulator NreC
MDAEPGANLSVVIIEDHALYRKGLCAQFETDSAIEVIAEFGNTAEAVPAVLDLRPSVIVMDLHLPLTSGARPTHCGIQAITDIRKRWPAANIVVITMFDDEERVREALKAGARSFLSKDGPPHEVIEAVRLTAQGTAFLTHEASEILTRILPHTRNGSTSFSELTTRENEQLALAAAGCTDRQIAERLAIKVKTVANYWAYIRTKLGVATREAAVELARAKGFRPDGSGEPG